LITACDGSRTAKKWLWTAKSISAELKINYIAPKLRVIAAFRASANSHPTKNPLILRLTQALSGPKVKSLPLWILSHSKFTPHLF